MQRLTRIPKHWLLAAALALIAASAGAVAYAQGPDVHACVNNTNGNTRVVAAGIFAITGNAACSQNETPVTWSIAGPQGPAGPLGPPGPQGNLGPQGAPGISGWEKVELTTAEGTQYAAAYNIHCSGGKRVLSGGYRVLGPGRTGVIVMTSQPGASGDWWYFEAHGDAYPVSTAWNVTLFAVCATVAP